MKEEQQLHRDIYVGVVAEEMAQSGYFGEEVTRYGFLAADDEGWTLCAYDDEYSAVTDYLIKLAAGALVSEMSSARKRCAAKEQAAAVRDVDKLLQAQLVPAPICARHVFDGAPFWRYLETLDTVARAEKSRALAGLLTVPAFSLAADEKAALAALLPEDDTPASARRFYGCFFKGADGWQPLLNGSLPTLFHKWLGAARDFPVTPILPMHLQSRQPIYLLKESFAVQLTATMDEPYLQMLDQLYANCR